MVDLNLVLSTNYLVLKHKCNEIYNQNHNKQNNKDNEPKSATAMYGLNGVQKHTI